MKKIVIVTPGSISKSDMAKLSKEGYIVIVSVNPSEIRIVDVLDGIDGNKMLKAISTGISNGNDAATKRSVADEVLKLFK